MKKKILIIILSVIILLVLISIILSFILGTFIKSRIINYAKEKFNLDIGIRNTSLSFLGGIVSLNNICIKNPDGFKEKYIFYADKIDISSNLLSIFLKKALIINVSIINPRFLLEKNRDGNLNLKIILDSIREKSIMPQETAKEEKQKKEDFDFYLEKLLIRRGTISFTDYTIDDVSNRIDLRDIFVLLKVASLIPEQDNIPLSLRATAELPTKRHGLLKIEGNGFVSKNSQTLNLNSEAKDIEMNYIKGLFSKGLRNSIGSGILYLTSPIKYENNLIDSLITIRLSEFELRQTEDSPSLFGMPITRLIEGFKDDKGEIEFDVIAKGSPGALRFQFGPLSQRKMAKMTIDIIKEGVKEGIESIGEKGKDAEDKIDNAVSRIRIFLDFKDKKKEEKKEDIEKP